MSPGQPQGLLLVQASWRKVLALGEGLLLLAQQTFADSVPVTETIAAQRDYIEEQVAHLLNGRASLWLAEDVLKTFAGKSQARGAAPFLPGQPPLPPTPVMRQSLDTRLVYCDEQGGVGECWAATQWPVDGAVTAIAAPLLLQDFESQTTRLLGVLQIEHTDLLPFTQTEAELLEGMAIQSALGIQAGLRMASERWRLEQLSLVRQVSLQIADLHDLDDLSRRITQLIFQTFNYYYVGIFTLEAGQETLHYRAGAGPARSEPGAPGAEAHSPVLMVNVGQGIIGQVAQTGQEILANDVSQERRYRQVDTLPETRAEATLPLKVEDRLLGVLDVQSDQSGYFDETDLLVLRALAGNIAFAVEEARLYNTLQQRAQQLSAIYEVSSAINSILDEEQLLNEVVNLIQRHFDYPYVYLFTVHPDRRKIIYKAGGGLRSDLSEDRGYDHDLDDSEGLIPWVARHGETALVNEVSLDSRYSPSPLPPDETLSELTVPLKFASQVLGVLDVQSDQLNAFKEEDRFLFEALADHIAIAMRNAYLYRSESWRRRAADSLREVAGLLSADVDLDRVLDAILVELERTFPFDMAAIWLLDGSAVEDSFNSSPQLHLAAVRGECTIDLELEVGSSPAEVVSYTSSEIEGFTSEQASTWLLEALRSDQPIIRDPQSPFDPLGTALNFSADYSAIAAPLRVGEQPLGVLVLAHGSSDRYGSEAKDMTAAFASYAAVAIENARLYEAAHEQAWVSTVLLQVAEATQSINNLNELLNTVVRIAPTLADVKACLLYILNEDQTFVPVAASGLSPQQQAEFERWRFTQGDVLALDQLLADKQAVILQDDPDDRRLSNILLVGNEHAAEVGVLVLVPLQAHGAVLGVFLVNYSAGLLGQDTGDILEELFDEKLAIIQGIAHQTAIAVENIRLLKTQKEEAYLSVALLQVAQAVVSSNDLEEALGSIVRLTPILAGVERSVIYLWDERQASFHLSQSYGLPRSEEGRIVALGEFPLLDAVLLEDSLLTLPYCGSSAAPDEVRHVWTDMPAPDLEDVDRYLEEEPCLLIAFPLSVKGKVLGVLLVEEPESVVIEGLGSDNANRRLRKKRLEIITGISQQAALAIENDRLQHEMVERERLEREMQLAHQIQARFLPDRVPYLPGWEIKTYWRTAREVGGDFYDFFELSGNRLGLVIADVADKGMPAALFMTLVRTLLRATVQEVGSPAQVLERVNDILVPDAAQGMFVTIVYAVLSLETGEVEIANAGHNPPVIVRARTCKLERIQRGGMALGVLEDTSIQGRITRLEPGDFLILYTDGVTEAFSPTGEMYEEQRLLETIESVALCAAGSNELPSLSAQQILEAIDQSVASFIHDSQPSDDMTLLVLKRLPG